MNSIGPGIPLAVVGCDFRTAPSRLRSRLVLTDVETQRLASELRRSAQCNGFLELATCNRNEWIISGGHPKWAAALLNAEMLKKAGLEREGRGKPYEHLGEQAAEHVLRVSLGLESLVIGERQIAGQLFRAIERARRLGTSSRLLNGLGSVAGRLVRRGVNLGLRGRHARGVHSLAVDYLFDHLGSLTSRKIALVGLGSIGRRVMGMLEHHRPGRLIPISRSAGDETPAHWQPISRLSSVLREVDAAIVCTGASRPVILTRHLPARRPIHPLLLIDIGIPSQVEREGLPDGVTVADLDQLTAYHRTSCQDSDSVLESALGSMLEDAVGELRVFCGTQSLSGLLDAVEGGNRRLANEELRRLIELKLSDLPRDSRGRLCEDLGDVILKRMNDTIRSIRSASAKLIQD